MNSFRNSLIVLPACFFLMSCQSAKKNDLAAADSKAEPSKIEKQVVELSSAISDLTTRVDEMDKKLGDLDENYSKSKMKLEAFIKTQPVYKTGVLDLDLGDQGVAVVPPMDPNDPEAGFENDGAVKSFRKAMILFKAKKYSDAILSFSGFVDQYPDHTFAGMAQYYLGECYFQQKELKLAAQEYKRVLVSYDRCPRVPETLRRLAETYDQLGDAEKAAKHRQQLTSLFPQSRPATELLQNSLAPVKDTPEMVKKAVKDAQESHSALNEKEHSSESEAHPE